MPNTTNFNWTTPADTDLVKDGALAIRTLANGIDTSLVDLKGGTTGQVLSKATNTDLDFTWVAQDDSNAIQNAIIDAKGDLIVGTAADTPARLAIGATNGHVLTVDSAEASGMKWAAVGGGKVLQVVSVQKTDKLALTTSATARTFTDVTGYSASITPSSATSKVLVVFNIGSSGCLNSNDRPYLKLVRDSTDIAVGDAATGIEASEAAFINDGNTAIKRTIIWLDSPATTSSTTYKLQVAANVISGIMTFNAGFGNNNDSANIASQILLLEIGA